VFSLPAAAGPELAGALSSSTRHGREQLKGMARGTARNTAPSFTSASLTADNRSYQSYQTYHIGHFSVMIQAVTEVFFHSKQGGPNEFGFSTT
jgi:hypothetical protein